MKKRLNPTQIYVASALTHALREGQLEEINRDVQLNVLRFDVVFDDRRSRYFINDEEVSEGIFDFYLDLERTLHGRTL